MSKFKKAIRSRGNWVGVVIFLIAGFDGVRELIPVAYVTPLLTLLTALLGYLKVNPSQNYSE